jgi:chemotaxis protein MotA
MDPITVIGVLGALVAIIVSNIMEGGSPMSLLLIPPMLLVWVGTTGVSMAGGTMADAKAVPGSLIKAFSGSAASSADVVPVVVSLADKARKEGLLALEDSLKEIDDPFLVQGVTMAVDGTDPEEMREILDGAVIAKKAAVKQGAKFFADAGAYAPTIGIVGTVMGLVHVLENLSEPEKLGHLIAGAFVATLWGVMSANVLFLPVAARLKRLGELEVTRMEVTIEGVLAIQAGANPRVVAAKLAALLPAHEQLEAEAA